MDAIAVVTCREDPLVVYADRSRAHGLYHRMRQAEHTRFLIMLNGLGAWMAACQANGITCGKLMSVVPAERGTLTILHIPNAGCFL